MKRQLLMAWAALTISLVLFASAQAQDSTSTPKRTLNVVATSHLDTQWRWTIQKTINDYIPATARDNFKLFEEFPDYTFSFEGAFRYMLLKEYYPEEYRKLKDYIAAGRWRVAGSWVDAVDVNIPSEESLIRQALFGNEFFQREFGKTSRDVFLPDCFGFGYALPSIAAHCGLKGFSTQKLTWGSAYGVPFDIGLWKGVDGNGLVAALNPGSYVSQIRSDLSRDTTWIRVIDKQGESSGLYADFKYFGTGDTGGAPDSESVAWLEQSLHSDGPITVRSAASDDLARSLAPEQIERLPRYDGELLMTRHGVGCYTSQAAMKRWNRKNELLADAAEKASVMALLLGGATYPRERLRESWIRFLWHQFHDDLTGTSIPEAYEFSWNDEIISQKSFASILKNAVEAVAAGLDTRVEGIPLVVYNPLSIYRNGLIEAAVVFAGKPFEQISVFSPEGHEMPSQILTCSEDSATILFFAQAPPLGFAVYDIRSVNAPRTIRDRVAVSDSTLENGWYRVAINEAGDVASIYDKRLERELLSQPARLELLNDTPNNWPAWEIDYANVMAPPREFLGGPAEITILERGPLRGALQVKRRIGQSEFTQIIRLAAAGSAAHRVEFDTHIRWREKETLLKAAFHLTSPSDSVTYDLGLGTIKRGLNKPELYEVPGHQWADLTAEDGSFGVSILNDSKYGWDHPDPQTLRLTLIHTPAVGKNWGWVGDQSSQDIGEHQMKYALVGHRRDWKEGGIPWEAAKMNQPLLAFQATKHEGVFGKQYSLIGLVQPEAAEAIPAVAIKAVKMAEEGDDIIVRLQELFGWPSNSIVVRFAEPMISAREVNGAEEPLGDAPIRDGALWTTFSPYQMRTFAVRLAWPEQQLARPGSVPLVLPCNLDGISNDENRQDGDFDVRGRTLAAELIPDTLTLEDIPFIFGSKVSGAHNAVLCEGQIINLPKGKYDELHLLACSVEGQPSLGEFEIGREIEKVWIDDFQQKAGQWNNRIVGGCMTQEASEIAPSYISRSDIGWMGTHHHSAKGENAAYEFTYLYHINFDIPKGAKTLKLPHNPAIRLMAATLVERNRERIRSAQPLHDMTNATLAEIHATRLSFIDSTQVKMTSPIPGAIIRFTLDGAAPTDVSAIYQNPFTIRESATIKARAFCEGMNDEYIATLKVQKHIPQDPIYIGGLSRGLACRYYEGEWSQLPNFDSLTVIRESSLPTITIPEFAHPEKFGLDFFGFILIPRNGMYRFYLTSDDGSALYVGRELVVNNDGIHGEWEESGEIALKQGYHPLRIVMFQKLGGLALSAAIEGPGMEKQAIGAQMLFHAGGGK